MAQDRVGWAPGWNSRHSRSYGLSEAQVQAGPDQPGPGVGRPLEQTVHIEGSISLSVSI